jgi:hypothetical protein
VDVLRSISGPFLIPLQYSIEGASKSVNLYSQEKTFFFQTAQGKFVLAITSHANLACRGAHPKGANVKGVRARAPHGIGRCADDTRAACAARSATLDLDERATVGGALSDFHYLPVSSAATARKWLAAFLLSMFPLSDDRVLHDAHNRETRGQEDHVPRFSRLNLRAAVT